MRLGLSLGHRPLDAGAHQPHAHAAWHHTMHPRRRGGPSRVVTSASAAPTAETVTTAGTVPSSWPSAAARAVAYSTVAVEEAEGVEASVSGRLPPWLAGDFLRNGPGNYEGMQHMFDGFSLLAKVEVDGATNSARASHRFLQSDAYRHFKQTGRLKWREVGTPVPHASLAEAAADVAQTLLGMMGIGEGVTDNASVNVLPLAGSCLAMTETVQGTYLVDPATLRTLRRLCYADGIRGDITTAHPTLLPNGDLVNFLSTVRVVDWVGGGFHIYKQPASDPTRRQTLARVPHRHVFAPSWVHDFPSSQRYAVIPEMPLYFNLWLLLSGGSNENLFMDWRPQEGSRLHVVPLDGGKVKTFTAPPFFVFHWVNAWESECGRYLHIDGAVYEDTKVVSDLYLDPVRADYSPGAGIAPSHFRRLTVDLQAPDGSEVEATWEPLVDDEDSYGHFFEFPTISPAVRGRPYRYAYGACATRPTNAANSLVKFDTHGRSCKVWHEPGALVGEPAFVPAPGAAAEDEGAVLSVLTQADGRAALLVLDGSSFDEVARAVLPYGLPNGFHGGFLPARPAQ